MACMRINFFNTVFVEVETLLEFDQGLEQSMDLY